MASADACIVADAGPLIALARIDGLDWPGELFGGVRIPADVLREVQAKPEREDFRRIGEHLQRDARYSIVPDWEDPVVAAGGLGRGETIALSLARRDGHRVLLDDRDARSLARALDIPVVGVLGLLALAKQRGLIEELATHVRSLRRSGYFLGDALVRQILRSADES